MLKYGHINIYQYFVMKTDIILGMRAEFEFTSADSSLLDL